jgi:hypothetical protein
VRKLVLGADGRGIKILRADNSSALEEVRTLAKSMEQNWLVQRYISNPMLFDGHKFDFRIHVMVASAEPLRVLVYKEGLAKLAKRKWGDAQKKNDNNATDQDVDCDTDCHATNGKLIEGMGRCSYEDLSNVLETLGQSGAANATKVWAEIKRVAVSTIKAAFLHYENVRVKPQLSRPICQYAVFGFDFVLDDNAKLWLVEVNPRCGIANRDTETLCTAKAHTASQKQKQKFVHTTMALMADAQQEDTRAREMLKGNKYAYNT